MKFLIDMNLSPDWVRVLKSAGFESLHWSTVGNPTDKDIVIFDWAKANGYAIITLDVDFGTLLAQTHSTSPSVIQIRREDVDPDHLAPVLYDLLDRYRNFIESGILIVIDEHRVRLRQLPV